MSKVTKYLLKRINSLETELFSVKNQNVIFESEIEDLESQIKNLNWSVEEGESIIFSKERLISDLENQIEKLSPESKSTFGDLDVFKELKEKLSKEERDWRKKQKDEDIF